MKRTLRLVTLASMACVLAACGSTSDSNTPTPGPNVSGAVSEAKVVKADRPVPASMTGPAKVEQLCAAIRYHEMVYFRELIDAANLKQEPAKKAAYIKLADALKAQALRTPDARLRKGIGEYIGGLKRLVKEDKDADVSTGRGILALNCDDRELAADAKPFHNVTDPSVVSNIDTTCKDYLDTMGTNLKIYDATQVKAFSDSATDAEVQAAKKAATEWADADVRLAGAAIDYDLKAALTLQGRIVAEAAAGTTSARAMTLGEWLISEEFDAADQVLLRYCGKRKL